MKRLEFFAAIERYHSIQNPTSEEKLDLAASYCRLRDGMRVLDAGCGKGWMLRRLASRFAIEATGLEINPAFAAEARRLAQEQGLTNRIKIVEGPALDFHPEPASYDLVMCIGASFALGGFEPAMEWMTRAAKPGATIAIGEIFARQLPFPDEVTGDGHSLGYEPRTLWMTVERMRAHGLILRGIVEASDDEWNRYESLHWQAAVDWALENPGNPDAKTMIDPSSGQRFYFEIDRRCIGWAIFVLQNGLR